MLFWNSKVAFLKLYRLICRWIKTGSLNTYPSGVGVGSFIRRQVYEMEGISLVEVFERVAKKWTKRAIEGLSGCVQSRENQSYNIARVLVLYKSYWAVMNKIFIYASRTPVRK